MRYLKKILKVLGATAAILILLALLGLFSLLQWPQFVFNDRVMRDLASFASRFGAVLRWDEGRFEAHSLGLLHKRFAIDLDHLCFNLSQNRQQGCVGKLSLTVDAAWRGGGLKILELGPVVVADGDVSAQLDWSSDSHFDFNKIALPKILESTAIKPIALGFKRLDLQLGEAHLSGSGHLATASDERGKPNRLEIALNPSCGKFSGGISACLQKFTGSADLSWPDRYLKITHLGPVSLAGGELEIANASSPKKSGDGKFVLDLPALVLPDFLRDTTFETVSIGFDQIKIGSENNLIAGNLKLQADPTAEGRVGDIVLTANLERGLNLAPSRLQATVHSPSHFRQNDWSLDGAGRIALQDGSAIDAKFVLTPQGGKTYGLRFSADSNLKKINSHLVLSGELSEGQLKGTLEGTLAHPVPQIEKVSFSGCSFDFRQISRQNDQATLSFNCPLQADVPKLRLPDPAFNKYVSVPTQIKLKAKADLNTTFFPSLDKSVRGRLDLRLDTLTQNLLEVKGNTVTEFAGVPSQYPRNWKLDSKLDLSFLMPNFQKLKTTLQPTAFAIPAPLNVLDGTIELKVQGHADIAQNKGEIPVEFTTRLTSSDQRFNTDGKGEIKYALAKSGASSELNLELLLSELRIALPRLGYGALPAFFPDGRFVASKKTRGGSAVPANFKYTMKITTPPEQPARLISNLTKEDIPLQLDLTADKDKIGGTINVGETQLIFFRRNAEVRKFKITLAEPTEQSGVDGSVRVNYLEYKIDVIIVGTFKRPVVVFESDPPLDREQIISVLIYGRTFDTLNSDNANSVSAVSAAIADRAIALGSLFLLASAPIQSVGYNPATGEFSAKVRLAQGTSLNVGTREGKTQEVGLKKNVGGNWLLNTYFENDSDTGRQSGGALMEWYKRY